MSERYLAPHYDATKSERDHYKAMQLGSDALLHRLTSHHPAIIAALQRKQHQTGANDHDIQPRP